MKVIVVLLSILSVVLASLEPADYRPPGSPSQYLPPHEQDQQHHHQHHHHHQQSPLGGSTSSQYLPPNYNRPTSPPNQYIPPSQQPIPSSNYLPAVEKPQKPSRPVIPSNDYLPPPLPTRPPVQQDPSNEYLPPVTRPTSVPVVPANDYLPPKRPTPSVPSNDYLPPLPSSSRQKPPSSSSSSSIPVPVPVPKTEYLPPHLSDPSTPVPVPPKADYLPPTRQSSSSSASSQRTSPTTPVPRISVISVSPFKLDGPSYSNQGQRPSQSQTKYSGGSSLQTSASSSPVRSGGYPQAGYPSSSPKAYSGNRGYQQPSDNYLPPTSSGTNDVRQDSNLSGYRYGAAGRAGSAVEQTTAPAKYDFEYRVSDEFGNDYSHKESRSGAQTQGFYSVLLPDGRKQIVHYEADENGFKPRISYEEAATVLGPKAAQPGGDLGFSGYDSNANSLDTHGPY